jgi:hypothetical protein
MIVQHRIPNLISEFCKVFSSESNLNQKIIDEWELSDSYDVNNTPNMEEFKTRMKEFIKCNIIKEFEFELSNYHLNKIINESIEYI